MNCLGCNCSSRVTPVGNFWSSAGNFLGSNLGQAIVGLGTTAAGALITKQLSGGLVQSQTQQPILIQTPAPVTQQPAVQQPVQPPDNTMIYLAIAGVALLVAFKLK